MLVTLQAIETPSSISYLAAYLSFPSVCDRGCGTLANLTQLLIALQKLSNRYG